MKVSKEWIALVDELLEYGYSIEEAEQVANEECGYRGRKEK